jgi:serine/threonine-protein kinase
MLSRSVVLKLIRTDLLESERAKEQFLFEARATARFSHPNIVSIFAVGDHEGRPYVALEHIKGKTLSYVLRERKLSVEEVLNIGVSIARALAEAHNHNLLHRDLKPGNVMLAPDERVRILDFGLAAPMTESEQIIGWTDVTSVHAFGRTQHGHTIGIHGTPRYMAPEQWQMRPASSGTDAWALGHILFEMLMGDHLFADVDLAELPGLVSSASPLELPKVSDPIAQKIMMLVGRCVCKQASARPRVDEVLAELEAMRAPASAKQAPSTASGPLRVAGARRAIMGALLILLGVSLSVAGLLFSSGGPPTQAESMPPKPPGVPSKKEAIAPEPTTIPPDKEPKRPARRRKKRRAPHRGRKVPKNAVSPTAEVAGHGRVVVQSVFSKEPMWADVYLDGKHRGQTPLTIERVAAGVHQLRLTRKGFKPQSRGITVSPGEASRVLVTLRK